MKPAHVITAVLLISLVLPVACRKETEEDRVKKVVISVQEAAEKKDIGEVLDHVSKSYGDPRGHDYDGIKGLFAYYFFQHRKISVYIPDIEATVAGDAARTVFQAVLTGRTGEAAGKVIPEALGVYAFTVEFRREEGAWKVVSAQWERVSEGGQSPPP